MKRFLIPLLATMLVSQPVQSQDSTQAASASVGSVESADGSSSLQGTFKYQVPLDAVFETSFDPSNRSGTLFDISPDVFLNFSEGPEFNSIVLKFTGNYIRFRTTEVAGAIAVPDSSKLFHVYPMSLGLEADQSFDNATLIAEVGYVPFRLSPIGGNSAYKLGINPRIGVFAQAGYKFGLSDESDTGNAADESSEPADSEIGRIKLASNIQMPLFEFGKTSKTSVSILASADLWYDFINDEVYDRQEVVFRIGLGGATNLDFKYENGSGAPNFNQGDQFGVFLSTAF